MNIIKANYKLITFSVLTLLLLACVPFYSNSKDSSSNGNDIAIVDVQKVLQESAAAQDIREQISKKQNDYQTEISKQEESLRAEEKKLNEQKGILSDKAFEKKRDEFKEKVMKFQRNYQEKRASLDKSLNDALGQIQENVLKIIADLAEEKKFKIAIPSSQVMFAQANLNITDEVLKKLNDKLKKVSVAEPTPANKDSQAPLEQKNN